MADTAFLARGLLRRARSGTLATLAGGAPYASLVTVAAAHDGAVVMLLSDLADHSRNLKADPRASLLLEEAKGRTNPQTGPRVSLLGRVAPWDDAGAQARFLARHPAARRYAGFGDFRFYRLSVERAHWVGGFARARWIDGAAWHLDPDRAAAMAAAEPGLLARLNGAGAARLTDLAQRRLGRRGGGWSAVGLDLDGLDLRAGSRLARLDFENSRKDPAACLVAVDRHLSAT